MIGTFILLSLAAVGVVTILFLGGPEYHLYKADLHKSAINYFGESASAPTQVNGVAVLRNQSIIRGQSVFQPVSALEQGIACVQQYKKSKDPSLLRIAESELQLLNEAYPVNSKGERWITYAFPFALHQQKALTINPPWNSGMAQGLALELSTSLYFITGAQNFLQLAKEYFAPLEHVIKEKDLTKAPRFVTFMDPSGYVWFEEYAGDISPMRVINGHLYATLGIYDFWQVTGDHKARDLFLGGVETIRHYFPDFRNPGAPSWYSLGTKGLDKAASKKYHFIVTQQIAYVGQVLGSRCCRFRL